MTKAPPASRTAGRAVLGRIILALGGGYLLAAAIARGLAAILPGPRVEAAVAGTLVAYLGYVLAALFAFVPRRAVVAWAAILGTAGLFMALSWLDLR